MKVFLIIFFQFYFFNFFCQEQDTIVFKYQQIEEVHVVKDYYKKYNNALRRIRRVYPLALFAKEKLIEIDAEMDHIDSKRKRKKYSKKSNNELKDDFKFVLRDLYTEEGKILMKLIHRETGLTVAQIIKKYRGKLRSEFNDNLGKIWDQDLDATYDPEGEDWLLEKVIQDIKNNTVAFENEAKLLTKDEYKEKQKKYKINKKEAKKAMISKRKSGS